LEDKIFKFSIREHAILEGWRLEFNKMVSPNSNEGYANIIQDEKSVVEGIIYEVSDSDMAKLDCYEGYPSHYDRIKIRVKLDDGQEVEAVTYIAQPDKIGSGLKPSKEYLNHLLKGCDILSKEYCAKLRKLDTLK